MVAIGRCHVDVDFNVAVACVMSAEGTQAK